MFMTKVTRNTCTGRIIHRTQYFRIKNGLTQEEKFVATDKGLCGVNVYAIMKLGWLYQMSIVEVTKNKEPKQGGDFYIHCVQEYYEQCHGTKDFGIIPGKELVKAIDEYKAGKEVA